MLTAIFQIKNQFFNFKTYRSYDWLHLVLLIINAFVPFFVIALAILSSVRKNSGAYFWFTNLDNWTQQSNLLACFFVFMAFFKPNHRFFKNHHFLMWVMVYLFVTFIFSNVYVIFQLSGLLSTQIGHNVIQINPSSLGGIIYVPVNNSSPAIFFVFFSILMHLVNPLFFIVFGFLKMRLLKINYQTKLLYFLFYGSLYPMIYITYMIYIPWSGFEDNYKNSSYSVYGPLTQTKYNHFTWLWFIPLAAMFPISGWAVWAIDHIKPRKVKT